MKHHFYCEHRRVALRALTEADIEWVRCLRNQPQIRKWFNYSKELTSEQQKLWYQKYIIDPTDFMYVAVMRDQPDISIGTYADYNYDMENGTIEAGRLMVDSAHVTQRALGYDIVGCAVKLVFDNLPVQRINAEIFADNERSIKCTMGGGGFSIIERFEREGRELFRLAVTREEYLQSDIFNKESERRLNESRTEDGIVGR